MFVRIDCGIGRYRSIAEVLAWSFVAAVYIAGIIFLALY